MSWKGEPGPFFELTEQKQVHRLVAEIGHTLETAQSFPAPDGENHKILVDAYLLISAESALGHYETLLAEMPEQPLATALPYSGCTDEKGRR